MYVTQCESLINYYKTELGDRTCGYYGHYSTAELPQPQAFPIKRLVFPHFGTIQGDSGRTKPLRKIAENLHEDDTRCWLKHAANIAHCHIT